MIDQKLGHYRVEEKIGAGGMGEVYRARDEHLERDVAVKVLPTGTLADEAARKRFRREALALSRLNHPNIATVFDFDTQGGVDFLVMEHIAGVALSEKLAAGPLPEKEIARLGMQMAEGLAAAHAENIIHRDLKPANLRLTPDGRLKILDFGLAKLLRPAPDEAVTAESLSQSQLGAAAGTLPYMAPEQLRGEEVDARTDIYAAGCVLYELATAQRPFPVTQGPKLIDAILHQAPVPPSGLNPRVSPGLETVILKALDKEPDRRYQSARDLRADLDRLAAGLSVAPTPRPRRAWRVPALAAGAIILALAVLVGLNVGGLRHRLLGAPPPKIDSIAVLPLENLSRDPEQEYFADGMTEALITELSKIRALKVISRTSAMRYRNTDKPMPQIARELDVDALIEGSVVREGDQVRITVQLIHGPTDRHLWADSYQRELRGILALQSEVARAIASQVRVTVTPQEQARLARTRPVNPEAYRLYLLGRYHWNKRTPEGFQKAAEHFQQAIDLDPTYALAYAGLADTYYVLGENGFRPPRETHPKARAAALKAVELDPELAEGHVSLAGVMGDFDWDRAAAEREYKRAIELNPGYATARHWHAMLLSSLARHEEAIAEIEQARRLDPLSPRIAANVGFIYYFARRYDQAVHALNKALELDDHPSTHFRLGRVYLAQGRHEEAVAELTRAAELDRLDRGRRAGVGYAYALAGRQAEARKIVSELTQGSRQAYSDPYAIAVLYVGLGDKDKAFTWLEKAVVERFGFAHWLKVDPTLDPLRSDPRFQALLRRMNFPE